MEDSIVEIGVVKKLRIKEMKARKKAKKEGKAPPPPPILMQPQLQLKKDSSIKIVLTKEDVLKRERFPTTTTTLHQ